MRDVRDLPADLGALLQDESPDWEAILATVAAISDKQTLETLLIASIAAIRLMKLDEALVLASRAERLNGNSQLCAEVMATLNSLAGRFNEAAFYLKLVTTLENDDGEVAGFVRKHLPDPGDSFMGIHETPLLKNAFVAMGLGDFVMAEEFFRAHVQFFPDSIEAHLGVVACLTALGQHRSAQGAARAALHQFPGNVDLAVRLGRSLCFGGDYAAGRHVLMWARSLAEDPLDVMFEELLARLGNPDDDPVDLAKAFAAFGAAFAEAVPPLRRSGIDGEAEKITVGYVVGTPLPGSAIPDVIAGHDPRRFRVVGFGHGDLTANVNADYQRCFAEWRNIAGYDAHTIARLISGAEIDILVYAPSALIKNEIAAFLLRPAPIQVALRGVPYDYGVLVFDVILTDTHIEACGIPFSNTVALEGCCESFVRKQSDVVILPLEREEGEVLLGVPVSLHGLDAGLVAQVSSAILGVPGAKVLLGGIKTDIPGEVERLIEAFGNYGVSHRIDVVETAVLLQESDVVLWPRTPEHPAKLLDALYAGVPVVTQLGRGRHDRLASSLLTALGLQDTCVGATDQDVASLLSSWLQEDDRRDAFRDEIFTRLERSDIFDAVKRCHALEAQYERLWSAAAASEGK